MTVKTGSAWAGTFVTLDATGALATPSTGPAGTLYVDGVANGASVTITGSNPYKFAVTLPSLTAGQRVDMYITATISSIATAGIVASAQADTVLTSDVKTETAAILEDTGTTLDGLIRDIPTVSEFEARTLASASYALEATLTAIKGAGWTTETLAAIDVLIDAIKAKTDLLDLSAVSVNTPVVGSTIMVLRGDTLSADVTDLGDLTYYISLDFTVKQHAYDSDDEAIIRVRKNASGLTEGLVRFNGAAYPTGTDGSLTITDGATGDVTIMLKACVTDDLVPGSYDYDIQLIEADRVSTLTSGTFMVNADVTRMIA